MTEPSQPEPSQPDPAAPSAPSAPSAPPVSSSGSAAPPHPPDGHVALGGPRQPPLRLPIWVVIALVITVFSSCSAANDASEAASAAQQTLNRSGGITSSGDPDEEVHAMCQLLGAVAVKQGIDLEAVFAAGSGTVTQCQEAAQRAAQP